MAAARQILGQRSDLALQLQISDPSESMSIHDSEVMDESCIDRDDAGALGVVAARD
jgi:hypothetical protein